MNKYRSYGITLSTKEDIEGAGQTAIMKWLKKQDYAYGVIEHDKEGVRHAHAQVWYNEAREKGTIKKALKRIIEQHFPESKTHIAIRINIAYNDDYYEEYMQKDVIETLVDNPPPLQQTIEVDVYGKFGEKETKRIFRSEYYPSEEEQTKVKESANAVDKRFHRLETMFNDWVQGHDEPTSFLEQKVLVAKFLADSMYKSKTIAVITDKKAKTQLCNSLTRYIHSDGSVDDFLTEEDYNLFTNLIEGKTT